MRIENAGQEYISGKYEIVLKKNSEREEDLEFSLAVVEDDKLSLAKVQQKIESGKDDGDVVVQRADVIKKILVRSYPTQTPEWVSNVATKYGDELLLELYFIWQWRDRKAFEIMNEKKTELLKDMKPEDLFGKRKDGD